MLRNLFLLKYLRDTTESDKDFWERDDDLNCAIWDLVDIYIDNHIRLIQANAEDKGVTRSTLYSFVAELLESEDMDI